MQQRLRKFTRQPDRIGSRKITDRSLAIIFTIDRYQFIPTSLLVRLLSGNQQTTQRHLQSLYHNGLINRFAFSRIGSEFNYFLDNTDSLRLLVDQAHIQPDQLDWETVARNREKYSNFNDRIKSEPMSGSRLFLEHELMISRFHAMLELAQSREVELTDWRQGPALWNTVEVPKLSYDGEHDHWYEEQDNERLPHRPDAFFTLLFSRAGTGQQEHHFFYEADRKTTTKIRRIHDKFRAHFHFVVRQRLHQQHYGIPRVRAVLVETLDGRWAERLRQATRHPLVSGQHPSSLFWFTTSELFTRLEQNQGCSLPRFLHRPQIIFNRIWASPLDDTLHSLLDP